MDKSVKEKWENVFTNSNRFEKVSNLQFRRIIPKQLPIPWIFKTDGTLWCEKCKKFFCFCKTSIDYHASNKRKISTDLYCNEIMSSSSS